MSDVTRTETVSATYDRPAGVVDEAQSILANKVSWGAIVAGIVVALVTQILLTLLGVGIGAATLDPGTGDNPEASTFSIVAALWYVVSGIIASYLGGYVAARLSGKTSSSTGAWHGLTAWAAATLIVLYLLTTGISSIVGGVFSGISSVIGGVAQTAATAAGAAAPAIAQADPLDFINRQVRATGTDPEALNQQAVNAIYNLVTGDEAQAEQARQQAAQALAQARGIPVEQAQSQVAQIEEQYRQTVDQVSAQATEAADTAATAVSTGAISAFIGLFLGAVAAWLGGRNGANHVHRDYMAADRVTTTTRRIT